MLDLSKKKIGDQLESVKGREYRYRGGNLWPRHLGEIQTTSNIVRIVIFTFYALLSIKTGKRYYEKILFSNNHIFEYPSIYVTVHDIHYIYIFPSFLLIYTVCLWLFFMALARVSI